MSDKTDKDIKIYDKDGKKTEVAYIEPADYIPEEIRKKYKLGEYKDDCDDEKASYEDMAYTDEPKVYNAPEGYVPEIVEPTEELKKLMEETPIG